MVLQAVAIQFHYTRAAEAGQEDGEHFTIRLQESKKIEDFRNRSPQIAYVFPRISLASSSRMCWASMDKNSALVGLPLSASTVRPNRA